MSTPISSSNSPVPSYMMFLDIETSGLPIKKGYNNYHSYKLLKKYDSSRIVQLSWIVTDHSGKKIKVRNFTIKPNGFVIPKEVEKIHGTSTEDALENGLDINFVFNKLKKDLKNVNEIIAHNIQFDAYVLFSEVYRNNKKTLLSVLHKKKYICTGESTRDVLKIKTSYKNYKMPTLGELYKWSFNKDMKGSHTSKYDTWNLYRIFFKIKNKLNNFVEVVIV